MKKILISFYSAWGACMLLLFAIAIAGCSTTKKVEKAKVQEAITTSVDAKSDKSETEASQVKTTTEKAADKTITQIEAETRELETRITEYDTDKPIVAGTNKSPIKSETITTNKVVAKKDTQYADKGSKKTTVDSTYASQLKESNKVLQNIKLKTELETQKTTGIAWWKWFLSGAAAALVLGLLIFWKGAAAWAIIKNIKIKKPT